MRALIVEDDASLAEVLEYNLSQEGYDVQVARDGQMGLREIRLRCPDLVVLDLMLPMIEGLEVCRLLRADPATAVAAPAFAPAPRQTVVPDQGALAASAPASKRNRRPRATTPCA